MNESEGFTGGAAFNRAVTHSISLYDRHTLLNKSFKPGGRNLPRYQDPRAKIPNLLYS